LRIDEKRSAQPGPVPRNRRRPRPPRHPQTDRLSHHHPDHTLNAALFPNAAFHDFHATYKDDLWTVREFPDGSETSQLSPAVRMLLTPGHSYEDVSMVVDTEDGMTVCTHLWWKADGPADDPFAPDPDLLRASRKKVLAMNAALIVPGHGAPFVPGPSTAH
jgi:glyoxylase-like metal-dependent hydrolase (beta-lactamase superfamily II)